MKTVHYYNRDECEFISVNFLTSAMIEIEIMKFPDLVSLTDEHRQYQPLK